MKRLLLSLVFWGVVMPVMAVIYPQYTNSNVYYVDPNANDTIAVVGIRERPFTLTTAFSSAPANSTIEVAPGSYYVGNISLHPANGVQIRCEPNVLVWNTNAGSVTATTHPLLVPSHGMRLYGGVFSNGVADITVATFGTAFGNLVNDPAATNWSVTGATFIGVADVAFIGSGNGPTIGVFDGCGFISRWDVGGSLAGATAGGSITFQNCDMISTNPVSMATTMTGWSANSVPCVLNKCRILINDQGLGGHPNAVGFGVLGPSRCYVLNTLIDITAFTANEFSYTPVDGTTNLMYGNVFRPNGKPLRMTFSGGNGWVEKVDNNSTVVAEFDSGSTAANIAGQVLVNRGLEAIYKATVLQFCTTAGGAGTLATTVTYTDPGENDITIKPATDIALTSTANLSVGSLVFREASFNNLTSLTSDIQFSSTISGGAGSPKYQVIVIIEQVGAN